MKVRARNRRGENEVEGIYAKIALDMHSEVQLGDQKLVFIKDFFPLKLADPENPSYGCTAIGNSAGWNT